MEKIPVQFAVEIPISLAYCYPQSTLMAGKSADRHMEYTFTVLVCNRNLQMICQR